MAQADPLVLYQFPFSHFNEKARWALDYKGLPARHENLLPGLHEKTLRKLGSDSTQVPVLVHGERVIAGSAAIVAHLEALAPSPPLFPADPASRREAEDWVRWLDAEIGPAVRLALFHEMFTDPNLSGRVFTTAQSGLKPAFYRRMFPRLVPMLRKKMQIDDGTAKAARETIEAGLDRVAQASRETGYLVGDRFGVADLTAAALFMPLCFPPQIPFEMPKIASPVLDAWLARWRDHPGVAHVLALWAKHR